MIFNKIIKDPGTGITYRIDLAFSWRNRIDYRDTVRLYILTYHALYTDSHWWERANYDN